MSSSRLYYAKEVLLEEVNPRGGDWHIKTGDRALHSAAEQHTF